MAQSNLPALSFPFFPQAFGTLIADEVRRVDQIMARAEWAPSCCYESPESSYGACDGGFPCSDVAVVSEIESGLGYCLPHFRRAGLDAGLAELRRG